MDTSVHNVLSITIISNKFNVDTTVCYQVIAHLLLNLENISRETG